MATEPERVLLVHRYFAPDVTTYAQMLDRFGQFLASHGHDVTVVCGPPSYNDAYRGEPVPRRQVRSGMTIRRLRIPRSNRRLGKLAGHVVFPVLVLAHVLTRRRPYDVVSVTTIPPVFMGVVGRLSRLRSRKTRFVYHCMDLYPEVAQASGLLESRRMARFARWVDTASLNSADQVIVLSNDMADTVRQRQGDAAVAIASNFILLDRNGVDELHEFERSGSRVRFVFAGNLGRFQGIDRLVEAVRLLMAERDDFEFVFIGAGAEVGMLRSAAQEGLPIRVWSHRPIEQAAAVIQDAHVAVVSLDPGVIRCAYPSKFMMYLELGRPVLGVVEPDSELGELIQDHDLGIAVCPDDTAAIAEAMSAMIDRHESFDAGAIQAVARREFDPDVVMERWMQLYGLGL